MNTIKLFFISIFSSLRNFQKTKNFKQLSHWFICVPLVGSIPYWIRIFYYAASKSSNYLHLQKEGEIIGLTISLCIVSLYEIIFSEKIKEKDKRESISILLVLLSFTFVCKLMSILSEYDDDINDTFVFSASIFFCFSSFLINFNLFKKIQKWKELD